VRCVAICATCQLAAFLSTMTQSCHSHCHALPVVLTQAVGRCIRHRFDAGAVILLDSRYGNPDSVAKLPAWIRRNVQVCDVQCARCMWLWVVCKLGLTHTFIINTDVHPLPPAGMPSTASRTRRRTTTSSGA
jgi:hypothetical protein